MALGPCVVGCASARGASYPGEGESSVPLPLQKLRLYDSGVGYFERAGELGGGDGSTVPVPAAHIDDALKTLIVMSDDGRVRVSSVEFQSILGKGLARVLAGIPVGTGKPIRYEDVLRSLRGLRVSVELLPQHGGEHIVGTLLEVAALASVSNGTTAEGTEVSDTESGDNAEQGEDAESRDDGGKSAARSQALEEFQLTLLTLDGGIRRLSTVRIETVRPSEPAVAQRLGMAATTLSKRAAQLERGLLLVAESKAKVRIGYIAEAPVWRATYRLVVPD